MINEVTLLGHLGRDPECRTTQAGDRVANLSLATTETWKDRNGERQERTEWHRVTVWGPLAEVCDKYLRKGSKVLVRGKLETRKWQDQSGQDRYTTEVVLRGPQAMLRMLDSRQGSSQQEPPQQPQEPQEQSGGGYDDLQDDIPF